MAYRSIEIELQREGQVLAIKLNRPDLRNAFSHDLVSEVMAVFREPAQRKGAEYKKVRLITIAGEGPIFCGGTQLSWLKDMLAMNTQENFEAAQHLTRLFYAIEQCHFPVIGIVQGVVMGPGVGLACVCDHVVADANTVFSLAEAKLGLVQTAVAPFLLNKVGFSHTRSLTITGEHIDAYQARAIGLIHEVVTGETLNKKREKVVDQILEGSPNANETAKRVIFSLSSDFDRKDFESALDFAAEQLAQLRTHPEAREGLAAMLEKRPPVWKPK